MLARIWATTTIATAVLGAVVASTDPGDCSKLAPPHHLYKNASGQYCCARHRRPLVSEHVFSTPSPLPIIDFAADMRHVSDCNPNSLYPYASLHRTKEFSEAGVLEYCPECERAILAAVAQIEADYRVHHH
jgi:hypothetical protein